MRAVQVAWDRNYSRFNLQLVKDRAICLNSTHPLENMALYQKLDLDEIMSWLLRGEASRYLSFDTYAFLLAAA